MRKFFFLFSFLAIVSSLSAQAVFTPIEGYMGAYEINGYSSNGQYLAGNIPYSVSQQNSVGFIYDVKENTLTELPCPANDLLIESFANDVTPDGSIIVGAFRDINHIVTDYSGNSNPLKVAGYYKNGKWNSLGLGITENSDDLFTDYYSHGSHATGISDDGKVIVGYISHKYSNSLPCAWVLNDETGEYIYRSYQLPENSNEIDGYGYGVITDISKDGNIVTGTYNVDGESDVISNPVIWIANTPVSIDFDDPIYNTNSVVISNNGRYVAMSVTLVNMDTEEPYNNIYIYEVENKNLTPAAFGSNTPFLTGVSDEGLVVGYDRLLILDWSTPTTIDHPYVYSQELGSIEFYDYIKTYASSLEEETKDRGHSLSDASQAQLLGISKSGKTFIGKDLGIGYGMFLNAFILSIDEGETPGPDPEPTPNPAYASTPMSAPNGEVIAGYSSDGRYLVGTDANTKISFLYDTQNETRTTLNINNQENSESKAFGVTLDGSIVIGSYKNPEHVIDGTAVHTAGYYKNGNWNALPIPAEYQERLTADYHYSSALAISDDGNTIVGVINIDNDYPAAWVYNSTQGAYEFITYQLPEGTRENIGRLTDISADGSIVVGLYQGITSWGNHPVIWKSSPETPATIGNVEEYLATTCKISGNGQYVVFNSNSDSDLEAQIYNTITGNIQNILFEETIPSVDPMMGEDKNKTIILGVSNEGIVAGYNENSTGSIFNGYTVTTKPYVYLSSTGETIDFYTYIVTKNSEFENILADLGLSLNEEELFSCLIGINSGSTTFIGLNKGIKVFGIRGASVTYENIFALTIDHEPGTGNNVGGTIVDFPFEENMFINGYSSNGRYVIGTDNDSGAAFLYDAKTEEFTLLNSENGSTSGAAVSKYGTIVAGTFTVNDREMAGYYKDGEWNLLPIPAEAEAGLTQAWYGSRAYAVSDDGSVIGGYIQLDKPSYPGAWYLNEETGEYEYILFSLPENASVLGRVEAVSGDGTVFYGSYSNGMDNYSIVWTAPDTYTTIQTPAGEEARYLDDFALSNNGKYIAIKTGQGDFGIYNVETAEFNVVELTEQASSFIIKGISDEGIVVGYINYNNANKPYIYSAELGEMDFQVYLSLLASKLGEETEGIGFSIEDEKYGELHGISANGKRFIGLYNSVEVQSGFWTVIKYENAFVITIDGGDNDDVEPDPIPEPDPEAPADPITVDTLFESEYRVTNYSSNANYLVGNAGGYGFVYDVAAKQLTQITTVNTSLAKAVSNDGSVVVGTINYPTGSETVVFKNGEYITLSSGDQEGSSITVNGVSDNGNIIVGYIYTTDNKSVPCKWTYNNDTQEYTYSALSIPTGLNRASAHSISADGTVIIGSGNGTTATGIVWQNNNPKVITEGLELLEISSSRISSNGKYAVINLVQKVEEKYANLAAIYDVEKDELNPMAFLTDEDLEDYPQYEQVTRSAFKGISDTGIAFGEVVLFGGFESEGSTLMLDYTKPYVYHPELGAVSLYEYIQKNNTALLREIIGYGIDMEEKLIGTEPIGISADGERFITTVSSPLKYVVLDIEYTYEKPGNSIDTESAAKVSIYPNPAIDYININGEIVKATLVNVQGQVVLERTENQLSVSSLPQGTYFLKVETVDGVFTQKVIIKK